MLVKEILEHRSDDDDNWNWRCLIVPFQLIILRRLLSFDPTFKSLTTYQYPCVIFGK